MNVGRFFFIIAGVGEKIKILIFDRKMCLERVLWNFLNISNHLHTFKRKLMQHKLLLC